MMITDIPVAAGSQLAPSFDQAHVRDAMRHGVISCPPETPLPIVARMMTTQHVHAVVVTPSEAERDADAAEPAWGIVSGATLMRAGARAAELTAGGAASTDFVKVEPDDSLSVAVSRMLAGGTTHAVVVTPSSERPLGVLSALDVAGVIAWGRGR